MKNNKYITCEQVELMREQENRNELSPIERLAPLSYEFTDYDIFQAMQLLFLKTRISKFNFVRRRVIDLLIENNEVIKFLRENGDLSYMLDDKKMKAIARKAKVKSLQCFSNSFFMALLLLGKNGVKDAKVVAGLATVPMPDEDKDNYFKHTFTHAVLQVGDYIYDYNYNIKLKAEQYMKFFQFNKLSEISAEECRKQYIIMREGKLSNQELGKYADMIYVTLANKDAMKRLYNYNVGTPITVGKQVLY